MHCRVASSTSTKDLLLVADNEAEVAGVMAHEIAHVAARHALENQTKAGLLEYLALGTSIFLGGIPGMIFQNTAGLGLLGAFMKFSRSAEAEADKLGVQYMWAAGYDPSAMATMFEKLEAKNKKKAGIDIESFRLASRASGSTCCRFGVGVKIS